MHYVYRVRGGACEVGMSQETARKGAEGAWEGAGGGPEEGAGSSECCVSSGFANTWPPEWALTWAPRAIPVAPGRVICVMFVLHLHRRAFACNNSYIRFVYQGPAVILPMLCLVLCLYRHAFLCNDLSDFCIRAPWLFYQCYVLWYVCIGCIFVHWRISCRASGKCWCQRVFRFCFLPFQNPCDDLCILCMGVARFVHCLFVLLRRSSSALFVSFRFLRYVATPCVVRKVLLFLLDGTGFECAGLFHLCLLFFVAQLTFHIMFYTIVLHRAHQSRYRIMFCVFVGIGSPCRVTRKSMESRQNL